MKRVAFATLIAGFATSGAAYADPPASLTTAGAATPSVGANITNVPNLFDTEFVAIRANLVSTKTNATLSVAPFLTPKLFKPWLSETRLGFLAEDSGSFAFGAAWGYSQARASLVSPMPSETAGELKKEPILGSPKLPQETALELNPEPIDIVLYSAVVALCESLRKCRADVRGAANCVLGSDRGDADDLSTVCSSFKDSKYENLGTKSRMVAERVLTSAPAGTPPNNLSRDAASILMLVEERKVLKNAAAIKVDDAVILKQQRKRLEDAYTNSFGFQVFGAVGFFPIFSVPPIVKDTSKGGDPEDPSAHDVSNIDVGASARFNFTRFVLVQVRGGYRHVRVDAFESTKFTAQNYYALDSAFFVPFKEVPDEKGFQPGVGFGVSGTYYNCLADGGCKTALNIGFYPEKLPLDWRTQITAFSELRLLKEIQFRVGFDAFIERVNGTIEGTAADVKSPTLRGIRPTLAVGSTFWGI